MYKYFFSITTIFLLVFTACKKKVEPLDSSNASVTLASAGTGYITDDIIVNPGDSIFFRYSVTSDKPMKYVSIQKNPVNHNAFLRRDTLAGIGATSHSGEKRFKSDTTNGDYIYRIVAHDVNGVYIGHKDVKVTTKPDFNYFTFRVLQVPDSTAKTNNCYMAATTGNLYNYTNGAAASASIDFGIYYDTTGKASTPTTDDSLFVAYALTSPQPSLSNLTNYDITSWTKNATIMKRGTSPAFSTLLSAGGLRSAAVTNLTTGARNKVTGLTTGQLLYFRTASGKAGCMQINFSSVTTYNTIVGKESYINVDVKIEK
jgi:hypothetical protein